ncbi:hypothetical protein [Geochorda subterranea]|uniref:Uncharacterized protein n=1 Tax=Geochorda subterranea TaxID=3109564 RepID=A0ABZ1BP06_9FIRM|nr:hypothetical protein [Limnochorda sp. LNt]WRP14537.1 hypothetical protein VLY81_14155 [Limnochorda sp. LNt]
MDRLLWQMDRGALATVGRYRQVRPNLLVKELHRKGHRRVLVCYNPAAGEDRPRRAEMVTRLAEALRQGPSAWRQYLKGPARHYLVTEANPPQLHRAGILDDARYVTSTLAPVEVALAHKGLLEVEASSRTLKTPLEIEPVYHWSDWSLTVAGLVGALRCAQSPP